jgi:hypothetical protein
VTEEFGVTDGGACVAGSETLEAADPQAATMQAVKAPTTSRVALVDTAFMGGACRPQPLLRTDSYRVERPAVAPSVL